MPEVDPEDDTVWRWVILHYRYDAVRRQRRDVVVAAYDNAAEFEAAVEQYHLEIQAGIDSGARDDRERVSGVVWHPGYHSEQARGRSLSQAVAHGVDPRSVPLDGPLPSNIAFFGWDSDGTAWSLGGGEPPLPPAS